MERGKWVKIISGARRNPNDRGTKGVIQPKKKLGGREMGVAKAWERSNKNPILQVAGQQSQKNDEFIIASVVLKRGEGTKGFPAIARKGTGTQKGSSSANRLKGGGCRSEGERETGIPRAQKNNRGTKPLGAEKDREIT